MNDRLFNYFLYFNNSLLKNRDLNNLFNLFDNLSVLNNNSISDYFYLLDPILHDNFLSQNWNFIRFSDNGICLYDFFNDLRNLYDLLYCLYDWNWFLNNSVYNLMSDLHMILYLFRISVLDERNNLLDDLLYLNDLWNLYNFLN